MHCYRRAIVADVSRLTTQAIGVVAIMKHRLAGGGAPLWTRGCPRLRSGSQLVVGAAAGWCSAWKRSNTKDRSLT